MRSANHTMLQLLAYIRGPDRRPCIGLSNAGYAKTNTLKIPACVCAKCGDWQSEVNDRKRQSDVDASSSGDGTRTTSDAGSWTQEV